MIPCCGSSFCDECVRTSLLESDDNECPDCHEKGSSPGSLIPNRFLRTSVNSFRNETGYNNRPRQQQQQPMAPVYVAAPPQKSVAEENPLATEDISPHGSPNTENEDSQQPPSMTKDEESRDDDGRSPDRKSSSGSDRDEHDDKSDSHVERDDSEDDDNITVTVPPAHQQSRTAYRDRQVNGGWSRPGYAPRGTYNNQPYVEHSRTSSQEDNSQHQGAGPSGDHHHGQSGPSQSQPQLQSHESHGDQQSRYNRPMYNDQRPGGSGYENSNYQNNNQNMPPGSNTNNQNMNAYGPPSRMNYEGNNMMAGQHFNRGAVGGVVYNNNNNNSRFPNPNVNYGMRGGPPGMSGAGIRPVVGSNPPMNQQLSNIYQGVAAKVGTGIIDDPLEAFNRIMREKEQMRKDERRRSPGESRRSRSIEMNRRRGSPERRTHGSPRRSPERRMRGDRRRRSSSYSSSRSR